MSPTSPQTPVDAFQQAVKQKFPVLVNSGKLVWDEQHRLFEMETETFNLVIGPYGPDFGNKTLQNTYLASLYYYDQAGARRTIFAKDGHDQEEVLGAIHSFVHAFLTDFS